MIKPLPIRISALTLAAALLLTSGCQPEPRGGDIGRFVWTLDRTAGTADLPAPDSTATLTVAFFDGRLYAAGPCNTLQAAYSLDGSKLVISDTDLTRHPCDQAAAEHAWLSRLTDSLSFSADDRGMILFLPGGQQRLYFRATPGGQMAAFREVLAFGQLERLFGEIPHDTMLHLYPVIAVDDLRQYPFRGVRIDTSYYRLFDEGIRQEWAADSGAVWAAGKFREFFICRVPGRYVSSDLALFRRTDRHLELVAKVAWAWCEAGWCNQQDAWLLDTNRDRRTDVVQHYALLDDKGSVRESMMRLLVQSADGLLQADTTRRPVAARFPLASL
ncbi:MAG: hypothetical protein RLY31_3033 [Bacteroidota bacterium]